MQIDYYAKTVYGNELLYVADPAMATHITRFTGEKSLTPRVIGLLELVGVKFNQVVTTAPLGASPYCLSLCQPAILHP